MAGTIPVGVLGATGAVGQRFVELLDGHPWFEVAEVAASDRSAGRAYGEAVNWKISAGPPAATSRLTLKGLEDRLESPVLFSALPSEVAGPVEERLAAAGHAVFSNARNHRMDADVPLMIPEVNPDHAAMIHHQRRRRGWAKGLLVTNPNCSTIHLVLALKPLCDRFGLRAVMVTTLQALSGAGYPGVASLDAVDNVVPYVGGEEEKMATEPLKLLGGLRGDAFVDADITISATCTRVAVRDGHTESVSLALGRPAALEEVASALADFRAKPQALGLPSAPARPVVVLSQPDRPQPILDRMAEGGMATLVGRLRPCPILDYKFVLLGHNTIRGAAGASILNAELLKVEGYLE
jgi:aspartate-semialdehyde dehydrogenase